MIIYKKLPLTFQIPDILQEDIDGLIDDLNNNNGNMEDCWRSEINNILNGCDLTLNDEEISLLREYYVRGGIYARTFEQARAEARLLMKNDINKHNKKEHHRDDTIH